MTTTVQHYLDKGLRGLWYPVLASWEVQSAPVGITRTGEQIVVWRNKDGRVQALEDRCPHRGARLSMGWNLGDRIACWYHGVEVAGNGEVKDVPAVDKCPLVGQQCVRSYNVQEAHGAIFLWFGVTADQQPDELTFPDELAGYGQLQQLPLHRRVEMQLPVRAGKRDGPDARHLSALLVALDGGRGSQGRHGAPADQNRFYFREERAERRQF